MLSKPESPCSLSKKQIWELLWDLFHKVDETIWSYLERASAVFTAGKLSFGILNWFWYDTGLIVFRSFDSEIIFHNEHFSNSNFKLFSRDCLQNNRTFVSLWIDFGRIVHKSAKYTNKSFLKVWYFWVSNVNKHLKSWVDFWGSDGGWRMKKGFETHWNIATFSATMNVHRGVRLVGLSRRFKQLNVLQTSCHHTQVTSHNSKDDILARLPNEFATSLNLSSDSKRYMIANNTEFYRDNSYFF